MLSIQDVGLSILGDAPKNFYVLGGSEYGIKSYYIESLCAKFGDKIEYDSIFDVINLFSKYQLIPLQSHTYVIRYDKSFVDKVGLPLVDRLQNLNIIGCIVLIYEEYNYIQKINKFFPDNTAIIDSIDSQRIIKYLKKAFNGLPNSYLKWASIYSVNYYHACTICNSLAHMKLDAPLTEFEFVDMFGLSSKYSDLDIQKVFANRDFKGVLYVTENYDGDSNNILYIFLRTLTELDKVKLSKYSDSPLKSYAEKWTPQEIYNMFNHIYGVLKDLRSGVSLDTSDSITYLASLLIYKPIPSYGVFK